MKVILPTCSTPSTQKEKASKKMKSSSEYSGQLRFPSYVSAEAFIAALPTPEWDDQSDALCHQFTLRFKSLSAYRISLQRSLGVGRTPLHLAGHPIPLRPSPSFIGDATVDNVSSNSG